MMLFQSRPQITIFTNHFMTLPKTVFLLLAFVSCLPTIIQAQNCQDTDRAALVALHEATSGNDWVNTWDLNQPMATWHGVSVNNDGCVSRINLSDNGLVGSLPDEFCQLSALTSINLMDNQLSGELPACLGDLSAVMMLYLGNNQFSGAIPESIGEMQNLIILSLGNNQFNGAIPESIGKLTNVISLDFRNNQLSGEIPSSIGVLEQLINLNLSNNQLSGSIPSAIGQLVNLQTLWLANNQLSGSIPSAIGQLYQLEWLALNNNLLSGNIPSELGDITSLTILFLNNNELTGNLPEALSQLVNLEDLQLNNNLLQDCFPASYKQFCSIEADFSNNPDLPLSGDFDAFCSGETVSCGEDPKNCIVFSVEGEEDGCYSTRRLAITITHGSPIFTVRLEGPITGQARTSSRAFRIPNAPIGTYKITIIDANSCEESKTLTISSECQFDRDNAVSTSRNSPTETILTIADFETTKSELQVAANYPNPFTQNTTLPFVLTKANDLNIRILTAAGQQVYQLQQTFEAGAHHLNFDANVFSQAGVYIYHIQHGEDLITGKLIRL